jgi:uncharacterized protein GlcG (DUF336 family)
MNGTWWAVAAVAAQAAGAGQITNQPHLSAAAQQSLAQRAVAACAATGARVAVAVATPDGVVRTLLSADGTSRIAVETARRKAISAVLVGYPTAGLTKAEAEAPAYVAMLRSIEPALVTIGGGVPIRVRGVVVGAIGVGGAAGPQADEACAQAAIAGEFGA